MATMSLSHKFIPKEMQVRKDLDLRSGDTVRVYVKIEEKGKTRSQIFEGLVLARKHGTQNGGTFTVRKVSNGIGVERVFPLYSPAIEKIEIIRRASTRRSKLYFIREKVARDIRRKMRNFSEFFASSNDLQIPVEAMIEEDEVPETPASPESSSEEASAEQTETTSPEFTPKSEPTEKSAE